MPGNLFLNRYSIGYRGLFNYRKVLRFNKIIDYMSGLDSKRVLDAGCGTGTYSIYLDKFGYKVSGVDIDQDKVDSGREFNKNLDLQQGSVLNLPFKDNTFDTVIMSEVLEHINDEKKALSEVYRVLNKSGAFILSVPTKKYARYFDEYNETHVREGYNKEILLDLISQKFNIEKISESGFLIEKLIKQLDFNLFKRKGSNYVEKSSNNSLKFKIYKYAVFPLIYTILLMDKLFKTKEGLNIILVSRKVQNVKL